MATKTKSRKLATKRAKPTPGSPEATRRLAVINARRAWGSHDATVEQGLKRIAAVRAEEDRLVEMVNAHWLLQREQEEIVGREQPGFQGAIAPGRRRDVAVELQRRRPLLLDNPPLRMPVMTPPPPTPEMIAVQERAAARDRQNVRRFSPAVHGTIPSGVSGL